MPVQERIRNAHIDVKAQGGGDRVEKGLAAWSEEIKRRPQGGVIALYLCGKAKALERIRALEKEGRHVLGLKHIT